MPRSLNLPGDYVFICALFWHQPHQDIHKPIFCKPWGCSNSNRNYASVVMDVPVSNCVRSECSQGTTLKAAVLASSFLLPLCAQRRPLLSATADFHTQLWNNFFFCFTSFTQNKGQECKWTHGNQMHMRFWLGPKHVLHSHWGTSQQPPQSVSLWGQVNSLACRAGPVPPLQNVIKKKVNGFTHTFYKVLHYSLRNWRRKRDKRLGKAITSPDQRTDHKE